MQHKTWKDNNFPLFLKLFSGILIMTALILFITVATINYSTRLWLNKKGQQLVNMGSQIVKDIDWTMHENIGTNDRNTPAYLSYVKQLKLSQDKCFPTGSGYFYTVIVKDGKEYMVCDPDNNWKPMEKSGDANKWEMEAWHGNASYTPEPYYNPEVGTIMSAYVPIMNKFGKVSSLLAVDLDASSLSTLLEIVKSSTLISLIPALLFSLVLSSILAKKFVEPLSLVKEVKEAINHAASEDSSAPEADEKWESLTPREKEILVLLADGISSNKEIASKLVISQHTVKVHLSNIFKKLDVTDRVNAVLYGVRKGLWGVKKQ